MPAEAVAETVPVSSICCSVSGGEDVSRMSVVRSRRSRSKDHARLADQNIDLDAKAHVQRAEFVPPLSSSLL